MFEPDASAFRLIQSKREFDFERVLSDRNKQ